MMQADKAIEIEKYLPSQIFCLTGQFISCILKVEKMNPSLFFEKGTKMISYGKLWHLLLDKSLKKTQLCEMAGISSSTLAKLGKNEVVSIDVLQRICYVLACDIGDIMSFREGEAEKNE